MLSAVVGLCRLCPQFVLGVTSYYMVTTVGPSIVMTMVWKVPTYIAQKTLDYVRSYQVVTPIFVHLEDVEDGEFVRMDVLDGDFFQIDN